MSKSKITCKNCGFEKTLSHKEISAHRQDGGIKCPTCGEMLPLPGIMPPQGGQDDKARAAADKAPTVNIYAKPGQSQAEEGAKAQKTGAAKFAETAGEKIQEAVRHGREDPLFVAELINSWLRRIAGRADRAFDSWGGKAVKLGHYTLIASAAIVFLAGILISLRSLSFAPLLNAVLLAAILLFGQFLALKGFELIKAYIEKNPSHLPGRTLPEVFSALSVLLMLLSGVCGIILTIGHASLAWLGIAAVGVIIGYFASAVFMECERRLNIRLDDSLPLSEVLIELAAAKLKALVAITPFIFGFGSLAMAISMLWPLVSMLLFSVNFSNSANFQLQQNGLLLCALMPILVYFYVILWAFILQLARVLLGLGKTK